MSFNHCLLHKDIYHSYQEKCPHCGQILGIEDLNHEIDIYTDAKECPHCEKPVVITKSTIIRFEVNTDNRVFDVFL